MKLKKLAVAMMGSLLFAATFAYAVPVKLVADDTNASGAMSGVDNVGSGAASSSMSGTGSVNNATGDSNSSSSSSADSSNSNDDMSADTATGDDDY